MRLCVSAVISAPSTASTIGVILSAMQNEVSNAQTHRATDDEATTCPRCGESNELAKVKGCVKCLKCGFKFDCNGW
jgi:ribosomal protein S27AE